MRFAVVVYFEVDALLCSAPDWESSMVTGSLVSESRFR